MKNTNELMDLLGTAAPDTLGEFLEHQQEELLDAETAFSQFMRQTLALHGFTQQRLFLDVELSQQFGYRLISGRKKTRQRDTILKLCYGGHFTLNEAQQALRLYGFAPLYVRLPRDAVLIKAFQEGYSSVEQVNRLLRENHQSPLKENDRQIQTEN